MKAIGFCTAVVTLVLGCVPTLVDQHGRYTVRARYEAAPRIDNGVCVVATVEQRYYPDATVPFGASRSQDVVVASRPVQCPPDLQAHLEEVRAVEDSFARAQTERAARAAAPSSGDAGELPGVMGNKLSAIYECASGRTGWAPIRVVFGADRSVASARLEDGPFRGTPEGACMEQAVQAIQLPESVATEVLPRSYLLPYTVVPTSTASEGTDAGSPPPETARPTRQECAVADAIRADLFNNRGVLLGLIASMGMHAGRSRLHGTVIRMVVVDDWLAIPDRQRKEWGEAIALGAVCDVADAHGVDLEQRDGAVVETVSSMSHALWTHIVYPPTEQEMDAAIQPHAAAVFACARGAQGRAVADITFDNTGRVSNVTVDASFLTAAQRTCVERSIRRNVRTRPFTEGNSVSIRKGFGFGG